MPTSVSLFMTGIFLPLIVVLSVAGCGGGGGYGSAPPPVPSTVVVTACTGTFAQVVNAVGITNFSPAAVTINVNDVVQWTNASGTVHTVTSTSAPPGSTFNAPLPNNSSVCLKFTVAGAYSYFCSLHPVMTGTVTVN